MCKVIEVTKGKKKNKNVYNWNNYNDDCSNIFNGAII